MDKVYEISLLLDFYGQLLTERQYEILDLHYNNDYSLGEIAQHLGISRQGVYDNIKRGKALLSNMEAKLGLLMKFSEQKSKAQALLGHINKISKANLSDQDRRCLLKIEEGIKEIVNTI